MDFATLLVRQVIRAFHTTQEILVVEALVQHSCLRDDDLAYLMKLNLKDLHRLCAGLANNRFLVVAQRQEAVEGKARPITRTYYFIDYRQAVDAIKWRWYKTSLTINEQGESTKKADKADYACPRCKAEYTQVGVLDCTFGSDGWQCEKCGTVLTEVTEKASAGHQQSARLNNQFDFMAQLLMQIDDAGVPECTFEKALAVARPIERAATHEALVSVPVESSKPTAVKGLSDTGPKSMSVTITTGNSEREAMEEAKKRRAQAEANALPEWYKTSTISTSNATFSFTSTSSTGVTRKLSFGDDDAPAKKVKLDVKAEEDDEDDIIFEDVM